VQEDQYHCYGGLERLCDGVLTSLINVELYCCHHCKFEYQEALRNWRDIEFFLNQIKKDKVKEV